MFGTIRLIIGLIFLFALVLVIKRSNVNRKRALYVISFVSSMLLVTVLAFVPFENCFVTFASSEEAYQYTKFGKADPDLVVTGLNADLVIDENDAKYEYLIIPKTDNGYKISIGADTKTVFSDVKENVIIHVYQYKNTDNFFVAVYDINGSSLSISDMYNSEFKALKSENSSTKKTFFTYYTSISKFESEYWISLNGKTILFVVH